MKKQWRMIIISGAVVVALAIVWLVASLTGGKDTKETTTATTLEAVFASTAAEVSRIDVSNEAGKYALLPQQTTDDAGAAKITWRVEGKDKFVFSADRLDEVGAIAANLAATEVISANAPDLAQYGLKDPQTTLTVTLKAGARHVIKIGNELPSGGKHYAMLDDTGRVCAIASGVSDSAAYGLLDLLDSTKVAGGIIATDVTRLTFERAMDQFKAVIDSIVTTTTDADGKASTSTEYKVLEPIKATGATVAMTTLFSEPIAISASEFIEMEPQDLAKYGLDKPQYTYTYKTKSGSLTLRVGKLSDTDHYYAISDAMPVVFTFPTELLKSPDVKLINLISRSVSLFSIYDVEQIDADIFGTRFSAGITLEEGKNVHDKETLLTLDGQDAKINDQSGSSLFISFFSKMVGIMATGIDVEAKPVNTHDARLTFQIGEDTENKVPAYTKVIEFAKRDDYTYYIFINGEYSGLYADGKASFTSEDESYEGILVAYKQMKYAIAHAVDGVFNTEEGYQLN